MKTVIVTGAYGYVGRHALIPLVERGFDVVALSSRQRDEHRSNIRSIAVDLFDRDQLSKVLARVRATHLLHLAWETTPPGYWNSPANLRWLTASVDLIQAFADAGGQRIVGVGTCAEYDWRFGYCRERVTPLQPRALYGVCKHSLALIVEEFAVTRNLSAAWGRLFFMYGPHEPPGKLAGSVVARLKRGEVARCSHGRQIRDFLYVADAADALAQLVDSDVRGPVNICSGEPRTLRELITALANEIDPEGQIDFGALAPSADEPALLMGDPQRLREEVGWRASHSLSQGIVAMLAAEAASSNGVS
jgi:nucleoside-diphosphate-sugar epimerase